MDDSYPWERLFTHSIDPFFGYVTSYTDACEIIKIFERETNSRFVVRGVKHQGIGTEAGSSVGCNHFIRFEDVKKQFPYIIECDNVPFICKNIQNFACHRGKKYEKSKHLKTFDHDYQNGGKRAIRNSKKQGCEAKVILREIVRFPEFKVVKNTEAMRKKTSKQLRAALSDTPNSIMIENRYYICLPTNIEHNHENNFTEDYVQELDEHLKKRIYQLVGDGVDSTTEIKRYLKEFVNSNKVVWFQNGSFLSQSSYGNILSGSNLEPEMGISNEKISNQSFVESGMEISTDIVLHDNIHSNEDTAEKSLSRSVAESRILLEELTNLTYNINNQNVADELNKKLKELLVSTSLETSGKSLPLELGKANTSSLEKKYSELPKRKKRKLMATKNK